MSDASKTIIKYRMSRARESIEDARQLLDRGSLNSTVNRMYYSMFYSVIALLLTENLSSPKHSGVRAIFNKEFVNKKIIDRDTGKFYSEIFEKRQKGDYKDLVTFEKDDVSSWIIKAEQFISTVEKIINSKIE